MELGIVRTHNGTIVTDKFFTAVAKVAKRLLVEQAELLSVELPSGCRKGTSSTDIGRHLLPSELVGHVKFSYSVRNNIRLTHNTFKFLIKIDLGN